MMAGGSAIVAKQTGHGPSASKANRARASDPYIATPISALTHSNIDHTRTKARSPQTNGICERFHKTVLNEFYRVAFRKKLYTTLEELQADLDAWLREYNEQRPHQGRWCYGKTPRQTFLDTLSLAKEKLLVA